MNIVITGSLGNISKPLVKELAKKNHAVTVISHNPDKQKHIEALGAEPAMGTIQDVSFIAKSFTGADIIYLMEPPFDVFDKSIDAFAFNTHIANNYAKAILQSGVKKVVHLSSIGGHANKGIGMLNFHNAAENILKELPADVCIKFMRPVVFYTNLFAFIPTIESQNAIILNYGGDDKMPWVSPLDIAAVIAEEMESPFNGRHYRYIASDEVSPNEIAKLLGEATGKSLKWIAVSDEQFFNSLMQIGMSESFARGWVDANASIGKLNGVLYEDYNKHKPALGKVKMKDFAKEFATALEKQ